MRVDHGKGFHMPAGRLNAVDAAGPSGLRSNLPELDGLRVIARAFGALADVLAHERVTPAAPGAGEVRVRMLASPINPSDLIPVAGAYRHRTKLPFVPGFEGVGIVEALGPDVAPALAGDRVLPLGSAGCWQTWKTLPAGWCVPVPADIGDDQAATAYINPLTAVLMLRMLGPRPGDRIGITAAGSAIGRMLIRMVADANAMPVALVRSARTGRALGGEPAEIILEGQTLPALDAGLDVVGGASGARLAAAIRPGGPLIHYGLLSGSPLVDAGHARLALFRLRDIVHAMSHADLRAAMDEVFGKIRLGHAAATVGARYPLDAWREALAHDARPGRQGKILLYP